MDELKFSIGKYEVRFEQGGIRVLKGEKLLYFNARPVYVSVKTYGAVNVFRDTAYERVYGEDQSVIGEALFVTGNGSEIQVRDTYSVCENGKND